MFEHSSDHKKLVLSDKLLSIKLQKNDTILRYLRKFTKGCDELGGVGVNFHEYLVSEREQLYNWERLWYDLVQEAIRWNTRDGTSSKSEDE